MRAGGLYRYLTAGRVQFLVDQHIDHAQGGMDGSEDLVCVDAAGLDLAGAVTPGDDALGQGVGAPTLGDADLEVG